MKKKFAIINLSLMIAVLFSILFQSVHSYEHFLSGKVATVSQSDDNGHTKIQTLDHDHEKCFVCEFTLSSFIATEAYTFDLFVPFKAVAYNFASVESSEFFAGSLYSHRGPPSNC
ncbi:MAG: hypothetical protein JNM71_02190 [Flavobacterium lindanitolerans]|uniref:hypothetical protein n=1 Tax=Flavobacterium lindanitolerans TaxID=428988 RepID=UPI001A406432|nr:hypothetical protein [Flavobacterium lindanitolerans]MBL7866808.1 hypothetical protein [Flavobacterium lindanitolerans]